MATFNGMLIEGLGMNQVADSDFPVHAQGGLLYSGIGDHLGSFEQPAGIQRPGYLAEPYYTGAGGGSNPPTIDGFSPAPGGITKTQALQFDVQDDISLPPLIVVSVAFGSRAEVAWDGAAFGVNYTGSSWTPIIIGPTTVGRHFTIVRTGGWPSSPVLNVRASDTHGNVASASASYTSPGQSNPTIGNYSPVPDSAITTTTLVQFDVMDVDSGGFQKVAIHAQYATHWEVIHDGDEFAPNFRTFSKRTAVAGGYAFAVRPNDGWTEAPAIVVRAIDLSES